MGRSNRPHGYRPECGKWIVAGERDQRGGAEHGQQYGKEKAPSQTVQREFQAERRSPAGLDYRDRKR